MSPGPAAGADPIARYSAQGAPNLAEVCQQLRAQIDAVLPKATCKIWHAIPVWFVGELPVVGYKLTQKHVNLLFWNGRAFADPALRPVGSFKAAQIQYTAADQLDRTALKRWLKLAGTKRWDLRKARERGPPKR